MSPNGPATIVAPGEIRAPDVLVCSQPRRRNWNVGPGTFSFWIALARRDVGRISTQTGQKHNRSNPNPAKLTRPHALSTRTRTIAIGGYSCWRRIACSTRFSLLPQPPGYFPGDRLASAFWDLRNP